MTTQEKSMHCKECGNKVNQMAAACMSCGTNPRLGSNFCSACGAQTNANQIVCVQCGTSLSLSGRFNDLSNKYAGFWKRAAAAFIDAMVIMPIGFLILAIVHWMGLYDLFLLFDLYYNPYVDPDYYLFYMLPSTIVGILYFCGMESSSKQATLGKMVLGIKVVDMNDKQISFGRALGRHFGKWISMLLCYIGFIMIGFTQKKQGLHDMLAAAQVINRNQ